MVKRNNLMLSSLRKVRTKKENIMVIVQFSNSLGFVNLYPTQ